MKRETYKKFVSQRSHAIAVCGTTNELLWVFELLPLLLQRQKQRSKQQCTTLMGIHHSTLMKCIKTNTTYLNSFKFKIISSNNLLLYKEKEISVFLNLVKQKRSHFESYKYRNKKAQKVYAQHIINPLLTFARSQRQGGQVFESQRDCAKFLKVDRGTLRKLLNNTEEKCFRKVWKLRIV